MSKENSKFETKFRKVPNSHDSTANADQVTEKRKDLPPKAARTFRDHCHVLAPSGPSGPFWANHPLPHFKDCGRRERTGIFAL